MEESEKQINSEDGEAAIEDKEEEEEQVEEEEEGEGESQ